MPSLGTTESDELFLGSSATSLYESLTSAVSAVFLLGERLERREPHFISSLILICMYLFERRQAQAHVPHEHRSVLFSMQCIVITSLEELVNGSAIQRRFNCGKFSSCCHPQNVSRCSIFGCYALL